MVGGATNITTFRVQNDWNMGVLILEVLDELFKLSFRPLRGKVSKLRLKCAHQIGSGIGDFTAELKDPFWIPL